VHIRYDLLVKIKLTLPYCHGHKHINNIASFRKLHLPSRGYGLIIPNPEGPEDCAQAGLAMPDFGIGLVTPTINGTSLGFKNIKPFNHSNFILLTSGADSRTISNSLLAHELSHKQHTLIMDLLGDHRFKMDGDESLAETFEKGAKSDGVHLCSKRFAVYAKTDQEVLDINDFYEDLCSKFKLEPATE